jgi:hypothetical protein
MSYFISSRFQKSVSFLNVNFEKSIDFSEAIFCGDAVFDNSRFFQAINFKNTNFASRAEFTKATFFGALDLKGARFDYLNIKWSYIKDKFVYDGPTILNLIKNYNNIENFKESDDCYYYYKNRCLSHRNWMEKSKYIDILSLISCGYGVRPLYTIIFGGSLIILFGIIYSFAEVHSSTNEPLYPLYHSISIFISDSNTRPEQGIIKYIEIFEKILGWLVMALFLITLDKVIIRRV